MKKPTREEYIEALKKISKNPNSRLKIASKYGLIATGGAAAASAASTAAIATSTATVFGSTSLGTAFTTLGLGALTATPVGWTIGLATLGVLGTAGLIKLYNSSISDEEKINKIREELKNRINDCENQTKQVDSYEQKLSKIAGLYALLLQLNIISDKETIELIFEGILNGTVDIDEALTAAKELIDNANISRAPLKTQQIDQ